MEGFWLLESWHTSIVPLHSSNTCSLSELLGNSRYKTCILIEMQPQIYTEVHHNPLTVTSISLYLSLFTLLTHFFYTEILLLWTELNHQGQVPLYPLSAVPFLFLIWSWFLPEGFNYLLYTRRISCTRGCLAEVYFEGFCTNLALREIKSKQTQREETERHLWGLAGTIFQ